MYFNHYNRPCLFTLRKTIKLFAANQKVVRKQNVNNDTETIVEDKKLASVTQLKKLPPWMNTTLTNELYVIEET